MRDYLRYYYFVNSKISLSTKIILMVECILLISSILFCTVSIYRARVGIRKAIQQRMLDIANCASGSVNGDVLKLLSKDNVGGPEYEEVYRTLAVFRDNVELEYVYGIREAGYKNFIFTIDLDQLTPASYGDSVKYTDALATAGRGKAAVDEVPYEDAWGQFYSAYSPVFDSSGKVAGIIAVDFSVRWFEDQLSAQTRSTVISYVIILISTLLLAAILSLLTVRPYVRLQGKLLEEKVRAESASNAKSDFLANMSHEIRTPINAVLGMNEMILREYGHTKEFAPDDTKASKEALKNIGGYAENVKKAGHNLLAIINDILDFSKIEAGQLDIIEAPYELSSLLNDLNNMMLYRAEDKDLTFSIHVDAELPDKLCGDEVRIRQILTNLLGNAVKYTDKGSVTLSLNGDKKEDGMLLLKASVKDTGIGIRKDDLEKLFTKFQRLEMEHNSTLEGTGLGLVISQRLLEMMGGNIDVESEYGKGSVFTVTIPQKILSDAPIGNLEKRFAANTPETGTYHESFRAPKARILIVDDTKVNLTVVSSLLKSTKMQIDTATSGAESVAMAEKTKYDIILMDQRMPEMDGTEALHRIRAAENGASSDSPVICLTADAVIGAKERYLAEGFSDYMTKPVNSAALEKMLARHLPADKVEYLSDGLQPESVETAPENGPMKKDFALLHEGGIKPQMALQYCQDDVALYLSLLTDYAQAEKEKTEKLNKALSEEDWDTYGIYVHSLKSSSKMIGALELFMQASKLEAAANEKDGDVIRKEHDSMMEKYKKVILSIHSVIPETEEDAATGDVLEFFPQGE